LDGQQANRYPGEFEERLPLFLAVRESKAFNAATHAERSIRQVSERSASVPVKESNELLLVGGDDLGACGTALRLGRSCTWTSPSIARAGGVTRHGSLPGPVDPVHEHAVSAVRWHFRAAHVPRGLAPKHELD
jgi:hypothetical protein